MPDTKDRKKGISGGHNSVEFYRALNSIGGRIVGAPKTTSVKGIYVVTYEIPAKNRDGTYNGEYKKPSSNPKTIYDPNIISDSQMLNYAKNAAAAGYQNAIKTRTPQYNSSYNGISFRVYLDLATGVVTNVHPR